MFQFLSLLCCAGPQKYIFDEIKTIEENEFRFHDPVRLLQINKSTKRTVRVHTDKFTARAVQEIGEGTIEEMNLKAFPAKQ